MVYNKVHTRMEKNYKQYSHEKLLPILVWKNLVNTRMEKSTPNTRMVKDSGNTRMVKF